MVDDEEAWKGDLDVYGRWAERPIQCTQLAWLSSFYRGGGLGNVVAQAWKGRVGAQACITPVGAVPLLSWMQVEPWRRRNAAGGRPIAGFQGLGVPLLELVVVDGLSLDMVLAGDRRRGVAWSTRPSRSASREGGSG
jgi:hypothetical protein